MMKITIRTHLCQSPAFAQVAGNGTCQRHDSLFPRSRMIRKCKMVTNVIQQETRHILCVLQITLLEAVLFLFTQGFPQQIFLLAIVANLRLSPYNKFFALFETSSWLYAALYLILIIAFNYFYVAIQYNPIEIANNLRKNNGAIPGIRPGKPTSDFIARVISRITLVGALFLGLIAVFPIIFSAITGTNVSLGGSSILIIVGVALETMRTLESQMMMRHHKGFLE